MHASGPASVWHHVEQGEPLQQLVRLSTILNAAKAEEQRDTQGEPLKKKLRSYPCAVPMMIHAFDTLDLSLWQPQQPQEMASEAWWQGKPLQ